MKLIKTIAVERITVKVYRNAEWDEYVAVPFVDGRKCIGSEYNSPDKDDAISTAYHMAAHFNPDAAAW